MKPNVSLGHLNRTLNPDNKTGTIVCRGLKREHLARWFYQLGFNIGAEIGVAGGHYSEVLCQHIPDLDLYCIDPWLKYRDNPRGGPQEQHDTNYELTKAKLAPYGATLVKAKSMDAVREVPTWGFECYQPQAAFQPHLPKTPFDFVYIDGHHSFDYVMQDLIEWGKLVRVDGIIAGHDYYHFRWAGVVEAVNAYVADHQVKQLFLTDEREPSFFFVKTEEDHPDFRKFKPACFAEAEAEWRRAEQQRTGTIPEDKSEVSQ